MFTDVIFTPALAKRAVTFAALTVVGVAWVGGIYYLHAQGIFAVGSGIVAALLTLLVGAFLLGIIEGLIFGSPFTMAVWLTVGAVVFGVGLAVGTGSGFLALVASGAGVVGAGQSAPRDRGQSGTRTG